MGPRNDENTYTIRFVLKVTLNDVKAMILLFSYVGR